MDENYQIFSHRDKEPENSVLYIVGTPIGNLNDISIRAKNILMKVSIIACEDTRITGNLLKKLNISNKLISFHKHNSYQRLDYLITKLSEGRSIALVSDAGMPSISDPGENLIKRARKANLDVICIPGPCAAINALVSSGLNASKFTFYGFIPKTSNERRNVLKAISESEISCIVYESPKRVIKLLKDLKKFCGGSREALLSKEITKRFEQHLGNNIDEVLESLNHIEPKGEFTLVISGNKKIKLNSISNEILKDDLVSLIKAGLSHSAASSYLSKKFGRSKKEIYNLIIDK